MSNTEFLWIIYLACWPVSIILTLIAVVAVFMMIRDRIKQTPNKPSEDK